MRTRTARMVIVVIGLVIAILTASVAEAPISSAAPGGYCRATVLGIGGRGLVQENPAGSPCQPMGDNFGLPYYIGWDQYTPYLGLLGSIEVAANSSAYTSTLPSNGEWTRATLDVPQVDLFFGGRNNSTFLRFEGVYSYALSAPSVFPVSRCEGIQVQGESHVVFTAKNLGGPNERTYSVDGPMTIPLGIGTLYLNQQKRTGNRIEQRAVFLDLPGTASDVVIGEAIAESSCPVA